MNPIKIILKYKTSRFLRNVLLVATGTAMAQLITVAFSPVITRLYGPEAFGLLGIFMSITHTLSPLAGLSYQNAIVLPNDDMEAIGLEKISKILSFILAFIVLIIIIFSGEFIISVFNAEKIGIFIYLVPLTIIFACYYQSSQQVMLRKKLFKSSAKIAVIQAFFLNSVKSCIGFFYPFASVLIWIAAMDNAFLAVMQTMAIPRKKVEGSIPKQFLWNIAKKYYEFPVYQTPQIFIGNAAPSIPVLLLAVFFGPSAVGFYTLGRKVLTMTTSLIGKSVSFVYYPHIASVVNQGKSLRRPLMKATLTLALVGIIPFGCVFIAGPWLFSLVFGHDWIKAGEYARWIALWTFFVFINRPSTSTLNVLYMQKFLLLFEMIQICVLTVGIYIGFRLFNSDLYAIMIFSLLAAILNIGLLIFTVLKTKKYK
jgi:O-antigen/teichoic acid export membrane protein